MKLRRIPPIPKWLNLLLPLALLLTTCTLLAESNKVVGRSVDTLLWHSVVTKEWNAKMASLNIRASVTNDNAVTSPLIISNPTDAPVHVPLCTLELPPISEDRYAVAGRVRYENMGSEGGYLEMWSVFPPTTLGGPERHFFSRTLGESVHDPMAKFVGTSYWRPMTLPFDATGAGAHPVRLEINALIPAQGTLWIGPLDTVQYFPPSLNEPTGKMRSIQTRNNPSQRMAVGCGLLLTALLGLLYWLAHRRQARTFVLAAAWIVALAGWTVWVSTVYALDRSPETWVSLWRAPSLLAAVAAGVFTVSAFYFGSHYRQTEWQRMAAIDASV